VLIISAAWLQSENFFNFELPLGFPYSKLFLEQIEVSDYCTTKRKPKTFQNVKHCYQRKFLR
jgi:hypothetical protein